MSAAAPDGAGGTAAIIDCAKRAEEVIPRFRSYPKLVSWLVLHAAGLPTVSGMIVTNWNLDVDRTIRTFADRWAARELLVRSDTARETGRSPRGGYVVPLGGIPRDILRLRNDGRVVFLLEPVSPLDDLYSLNFQPDRAWQEWELEIVGPGFDASDLKRGDVTPHERVRLAASGEEVRVLDRVVASAAAQAAGRATRLRKAAALLRCGRDEVEMVLRRRGETMLLDEPVYPRIPEELLALTVRHAMRLRDALVRHALDDQGVTLSMSFVGSSARPVFWDVVWPRNKYPGSVHLP